MRLRSVHEGRANQHVRDQFDLNYVTPDNDGNFPLVVNRDNSTSSTDGQVQVYFRNLSSALISEIKKADVVLGCVAWLTDFLIIDALRGKDVAIVVQKEDFLRPDLGASSDWKNHLHARYNTLSCNIERYSFKNMICNLSVCSDITIEPIRCVGNYNRDKSPAFPRMHNKFMIFAKLVEAAHNIVEEDNEYPIMVPYAVWTGSFNMTLNAQKSLENAVLLKDPVLVDAYFQEFGQIFAISEQLDWSSDWIEPEFRIGT